MSILAPRHVVTSRVATLEKETIVGLSPTALLEMLDADSRVYAETVASHLPPPPYSRYGTAGIRRLLNTADPERRPVRPVHSVGEHFVDTPAGELTVRCYRPSAETDLPAVLYYHGGGFVIGTLDGVDDLCRLLCTKSDSVVVSVEYRLAPEHAFPAAPDDAFWAHDWVIRHAGSLGVDPHRIALAGDSAGGNLALSVCTTLAENHHTMPAALVLAYPATSNAHQGPSWDVYEHAPVLCREDALWFWSQYARSADVENDPRAVPLLSSALHALPPTLLISAEIDVLRSDYENFASVASAAGADIDIRRYDGVLHGFFTEVAAIDKARHAISDAAHHLRKHFAR